MPNDRNTFRSAYSARIITDEAARLRDTWRDVFADRIVNPPIVSSEPARIASPLRTAFPSFYDLITPSRPMPNTPRRTNPIIDARAPNANCEIEMEAARWPIEGWSDFCGEEAPGGMFTCCLKRGHEGSVHIVIRARDGWIMARFTDEGEYQP